jgi:HEAT repeat protein
MALTSFLSDAGHEMVTAVLPGFLGTNGVAAGALGWIEGISDAASSIVKLGAGWYSDRIGHRKRIVLLGYFLTGTALALFAAAVSWPLVLLGRLISWFGRGIRGPLRDAMLSDSVDPEVRGKAFGLHRAGDKAIGPLREFLSYGRPSGIYQPRRWAVVVLASLGAKDVLIEYLRREKEIPDPVARFGEEAVENAAARVLAEWRTEDVFQVLMEIGRRRLLAGVVEALGEFERVEAVPILDRALEDDMCRPAAEEALRRIGETARPALVLSAITPLPSAEAESPSSLRRRRSVLGLLAEGGISPQDQAALRPLLSNMDPEIVVRTSQLLAPGAGPEDRSTIAHRLIEVLPSADWFLHQDIEGCLISMFDQAAPAIEREMSRRMALPERERVADPALRVLLRVRRETV